MQTALGLPSLAVAAFTNRKLAPDLQRDLAATMKEAESWATTVYAGALARADSLGDAERDSIVRGVSRFTGLDAALVDRKSLTVDRMQLGSYLLRRERKFIGQYDSRMVGPLDTTQAPYDPTKDPSLQNLLDDVYGAAVTSVTSSDTETDLKYQGPFGGGYPPPRAFRGDWMSVKWKHAPGDLGCGGAGSGKRAAAEFQRCVSFRPVASTTSCASTTATSGARAISTRGSRATSSCTATLVATPCIRTRAPHLQLKANVAEFIRRAAAPPPRPN
jgi:hypothetical protein